MPPTSEFPDPSPITPDDTTAFPGPPAPIVVAVVSFYGGEVTVFFPAESPASLGIEVGMGVAGQFIQPGTVVTAIFTDGEWPFDPLSQTPGVEISLPCMDEGGASGLTFSPAVAETTPFPPVVSPSGTPAETPPTPGHMAVWGPNRSLADGGAVPEGGGASGPLHLDLGGILPSGYAVYFDCEINPGDPGMPISPYIYSPAAALAGVGVGWRVHHAWVTPGAEIVSVAGDYLYFDPFWNPVIEGGYGTVGFFLSPEHLTGLAEALPGYDPAAGRDLLITGRIDPSAWACSTTPVIYIDLPSFDPGGETSRLTVRLETQADSFAGAVADLQITFVASDVLLGSYVLRDSARRIPDVGQTVEYTLQPNPDGTWNVLTGADALAFVPAREDALPALSAHIGVMGTAAAFSVMILLQDVTAESSLLTIADPELGQGPYDYMIAGWELSSGSFPATPAFILSNSGFGTWEVLLKEIIPATITGYYEAEVRLNFIRYKK